MFSIRIYSSHSNQPFWYVLRGFNHKVSETGVHHTCELFTYFCVSFFALTHVHKIQVQSTKQVNILFLSSNLLLKFHCLNNWKLLKPYMLPNILHANLKNIYTLFEMVIFFRNSYSWKLFLELSQKQTPNNFLRI